MTVIPKFNPGDKAWFICTDGMKKFAIKNALVRAVTIRLTKALGMQQSRIVTEVEYELAGQIETYTDSDLFESREALAASLEEEK